MVRALVRNAAEHRVPLFGLGDTRQGIVHVVGQEQGVTLPGLVIVCGDSHTSTHGAFGALRSVLAQPRSPTCWPRSAYGRFDRATCASAPRARCNPAQAPRT